MDSHVHLPQQGTCGDSVPVDHKHVQDSQRRDVLVAQNSIMTERHGDCFPVAAEWRSRSRQSPPQQLPWGAYCKALQSVRPRAKPCAAALSSIPWRPTWQLGSEHCSAPHGHLRGWRGAGCLPLPDPSKSPDSLALAGTGRKMLRVEDTATTSSKELSSEGEALYISPVQMRTVRNES